MHSLHCTHWPLWTACGSAAHTQALEKYDPTFLSSVGQLAIEVHMNVDPATGTPLEGTSTDLTLERLTTFISHLTERCGRARARRRRRRRRRLRLRLLGLGS